VNGKDAINADWLVRSDFSEIKCHILNLAVGNVNVESTFFFFWFGEKSYRILLDSFFHIPSNFICRVCTLAFLWGIKMEKKILVTSFVWVNI
jgi:hypothetical protein